MAIEVSTTECIDIMDITAEVAEAIASDVSNGICLVFVPHTTAGVVLNENERRLLADITEQSRASSRPTRTTNTTLSTTTLSHTSRQRYSARA
jgi:thiamine phosphate synthase YjbQ (UPF0047 family)